MALKIAIVFVCLVVVIIVMACLDSDELLEACGESPERDL